MHESAWDAFVALSGARSIGLGPEPIPISEIEAYARLMRLDGADEREELVRLVQAMDRAYLAWRAQRAAGRRVDHTGRSQARRPGS